MGKLNNIIVCVIGRSGCGKTTIVDTLHKQYGYEVLRSYTTRTKRHEDDTDHIYVDLQTFAALPNKVAYAEFDGNHYCALNYQIEDSDLYVVDFEGLRQLKELYQGTKRVVSVYIDVPQNILVERMKKRGDAEKKINSRIQHDKVAFADYKSKVDYIVNGVDNDTWTKVAFIIFKEINKKG